MVGRLDPFLFGCRPIFQVPCMLVYHGVCSVYHGIFKFQLFVFGLLGSWGKASLRQTPESRRSASSFVNGILCWGTSPWPSRSFFSDAKHGGILKRKKVIQIGTHFWWNQTWCKSRWWFQTFFIFTLTWGNDPIWLIFLRWVEITNQKCMVMLVGNPEFSNKSALFGVGFILWALFQAIS